MTAPPGSARRHQQDPPASARGGINKEMRRRAVHAIGVMNRVSFAQAREIYTNTLLPVIRDLPASEVEAYLRDTYRIDPTGVTAVRNVDRERGF